MNSYNPNISDYQDYFDFMQSIGKVCPCGNVIEHAGTSKFCSPQCNEYKKYKATRPLSKLDILTQAKNQLTTFRLAMEGIL